MNRSTQELLREALVSDRAAEDALIRIHPQRIISFGIDDDPPPHELRASRRDVVTFAE